MGRSKYRIPGLYSRCQLADYLISRLESAEPGIGEQLTVRNLDGTVDQKKTVEKRDNWVGYRQRRGLIPEPEERTPITKDKYGNHKYGGAQYMWTDLQAEEALNTLIANRCQDY